MKRKNLMVILGVIILTGYGLTSVVNADENTGEKSQVTVPWDEFRKLLRLDENEIVLSLETFQKLVAQTGIKTTPPHTIKEGNVVLSRAEFKKLIDKMKPPVDADAQPPFDYLITKAVYSGKMGKNNTAFSGIFNVQILKKDTYLKIPFLTQSLALEDVKVDGNQAMVVTERGYHHVVLRQTGDFVISASFSLKSSIDKGPQKIDLSIQETPITLLELEIPLKDIDVEIPQAQQVLISLRGSATVVSAIISPGRSISVRWRKKAAVVEKLPPKLYAEVLHLISIEDDALKINSDINYNILHSEVDMVRLLIPENINVLTVSGEGVGEWQEDLQGGERLIIVPFTYGKKGAVTINMTAEKPISDKGVTSEFGGIRILDTVRETGFIGIELKTSAEVKVTESEGLEMVAVQKLPASLFNKSLKPLIHGFKYLKHPYSLVLDIEKHEKIAFPVATINSGNFVTLFTEDGKVVHRLIYQVRNSAKQFLEIQLPEKADVWSVFVGNEPVESSINQQGKLLVPLIRSRTTNDRLKTFQVEVIYCLVEKRFSLIGSLHSSLPAVDLLISQVIWSVYLPNDYSYLYFKSTLEKEEIIRGLKILSTKKRRYDDDAMKEISKSAGRGAPQIAEEKLEEVYKGKDYQSRFRNIPLKEDQLSSQLNAELEFSGRVEGLSQQEVQKPSSSITTGTGVLPIQIMIPTGGQVYRFAKTIVKSEDEITISVSYTQSWLIRMVKWLFVFLIVLILYIKRQKTGRMLHWLKGNINSLFTFLNRYEEFVRKSIQSKLMPIVLFGLFILLLSISVKLSIFFLFICWVSVIYQVILYRERKAKKKSESLKKNKE